MNVPQKGADETWDRSVFALTIEQLELQEAQLAIQRALEHRDLREETRQALVLAVEMLRHEDA